MKYSLLSAALAVSTTAAMALDVRQQESRARVLVGNNGKISIADYANGEFKITMQEDDAASPTWMAYAGDNILYAVDEWTQAVRTFKLDLESNSLALKSEGNGSAGCVHLEFNKDKTRMVGSAYAGGKIDIWNIENKGLELVKTLDPPGKPSGAEESQQAQAHPHQALLDPSGRFFAVNDLGTDSIYIIDSEADYDIVSTVGVPKGNGPRHGAFYPADAEKATHYFVVSEIKNRITSYAVTYTDKGIDLKQIEDISSFEGEAPEGAAAGELVLVGDHIYVSNRLTGEKTDNIAHFIIAKCKKSGKTSLKFEATVSSGGVNPRMMSVSSSGKELFIAHVSGDAGLVSIGIKEDGSLEKKPNGSLANKEFGASGDGTGTAYVQQIEEIL